MNGRLVPIQLLSARSSRLISVHALPYCHLGSRTGTSSGIEKSRRKAAHSTSWARKMTDIAGTRSSAASTSSSTPTVPTLNLTEIEEALCVLLDDACRWIQSTLPQPDPVESGGVQVTYYDGWTLEARIAGGWVRDKLLGQDSHDLDISLSTLTGHIFALLLRSYLLSSDFSASKLANEPGSPFHSSSSSSDHLVGHITKIAANPEQSKNLETATAKVAGLQLDFVNLRKEVYVGNSRIPTMAFGTAQEDAERRDITINTLFYNVHSRKVEDFTGLGLSDLRNKIIRTPLSPQKTFLDDPLRVLRCVRFASRFDYNVHEDILRCFGGAEGSEILEALRCKVSRERFGIEVDKMMRGPDPFRAIDLMFQLSLHDVTFNPPPGSVLSNSSTRSSLHVLEASKVLDHLWRKAERRDEGKDGGDIEIDLPDNVLATLLNEDSRRLLFYNASLLHLHGVKWEGKRGKFFGADECVVSVGLKVSCFDRLGRLTVAVKLILIFSSFRFTTQESLYRI